MPRDDLVTIGTFSPLTGLSAHALLNLRRRGAEEPHRDHVSAFRLLVDDLEATHTRALAAGAVEQFPPADSPTTPRCSRLADPSGNRAVLHRARFRGVRER